MIVILIALNGAAAQTLTKEQKWNNYVNSQPALKQNVAKLAACESQLAKAKGNSEYLRVLAIRKSVSKGQTSDPPMPPEVVKAYKLVGELENKVSVANGLVGIDRLKWEKAMDKK